jgi:RNA recognition motif-containing protein
LSEIAARPIIRDGSFYFSWHETAGRKGKRTKMEVKLFIGNLSFATKEDDLRTLLAQAGTVTSCELIKDRSTGESKGFAFVVMATQQDAVKATQMFNGYSLDDREIKVGTAHEREESGRGGYDAKRGNGRPPAHKNRGGARRY